MTGLQTKSSRPRILTLLILFAFLASRHRLRVPVQSRILLSHDMGTLRQYWSWTDHCHYVSLF